MKNDPERRKRGGGCGGGARKNGKEVMREVEVSEVTNQILTTRLQMGAAKNREIT